jgi:hypothetical protein
VRDQAYNCTINDERGLATQHNGRRSKLANL